ncbi:MAG: hypothetical protein AB9866_30190 [Syntrophobacteraceae bacterium]
MDNAEDGILICDMGYRELIEAAAHLNNAFDLLVDVNEGIIDGIIDFKRYLSI